MTMVEANLETCRGHPCQTFFDQKVVIDKEKVRLELKENTVSFYKLAYTK